MKTIFQEKWRGREIGDVTVAIFLQEMRRGKKADSKPTPLVLEAMKKRSIKDLKDFANKNALDLVEVAECIVKGICLNPRD